MARFVLLAAIAAGVSVAQQIINNPSFELSATLGPDWNGTTNGGGVAVNTGSGSNGELASDGSNNAYLYPGNTISQYTSAMAGAVYRLDFDAYSLWEWQGNPKQENVQVSFRPSTPPGWESTLATYLTVPNGTTTFGPYAHFSMNVTAQGNDLLAISYISGTHSTLGADYSTALRIDNILLTYLADSTNSSANATIGGDSGTKVVHKNNPGLIAGCVVLGVAALGAAAYAFFARRPRTRGTDVEKRSSMGSEKPALSPQAHTERFSVAGSGSGHHGTATGSGLTYPTPPIPPPSREQQYQYQSPQRAPEVMAERPWNPYEQDTYEGYGRSTS